MTTENVFQIAQPETVDCRVQSYQWGRATLIVRLKRRHSPEVQYLHFNGVEYFAGPMEWANGAFDERSAEECLNLMRDAGRANEHVTLQHIEEMKYRLYTVTLSDTLVCVVAKRVSRHSA